MPSSPAIDAEYMHQAIRLAMRGRGTVEPNPMVGCLIVKNGRIIGQGWHQKYGGPHAEPTALAACTESPAGATAYVTLEPCCHTNKQTPPCVPRLIEARLARVVIGCADPNPDVAGRGIDKLRTAGIQVECGVCEMEAKQLASPFFIRMAGIHARPYVTLKWAETADGKIAGPDGARLQISNEQSSRAVHQLRARCDAILGGIQTVFTDDPMLTPRGVELARPQLRLVLDTQLRTPVRSKLVQSARHIPLRIYCSGSEINSMKAESLTAMGVEIAGLHAPENAPLALDAMLSTLSPDHITHLLVEPGPTLARSFFEQGWVDRLWVIRSPKRIDHESAPSAIAVPSNYVVTGRMDLAGDLLTEYLNPRSLAFFAPSPSADFVRIAELEI